MLTMEGAAAYGFVKLIDKLPYTLIEFLVINKIT